MSYELGIAEVGPAEYPLLEVLRETIFGEVGHRSLTPFAEILEGRRDVLTLIAYLEGNPIGFKVGCGDPHGDYHSRSGGVLKDYRRLGLGRRMRDWQHQFAASRGYKRIFFNTFNHFPEMLLFAFSSGFHPIAAEWRELGAMSFKFVKNLQDVPIELNPAEARSPIPAGDRLEVDHRDIARLHHYVSEGFHLTGIRHDPIARRVFVIVERPIALI